MNNKINVGERKLFKKSFSFPHTPFLSKTLKLRGYFFRYFVRSTVERTMFAPHPRVKVLVKLFQKLAGLGRAHKKRRFLFAKLFLCASCAKRKSGIVDFLLFIAGKKTF